MGKEIENHVTRMDLDSSGFLKGSQEVLKAIEKLESALAFKGATKGAEHIANVVSTTLPSAFNTGKNSAESFASSTEAALVHMSSTISDTLNTAVSSLASQFSALEAAALRTSEVMSGAFSEASVKAGEAALRIGESVQTASGSSQTAIGAAVSAISAKIASVVKVVAIVAAVGVAIALAVSAASKKIHDLVGTTVNGIHITISEKIKAIKEAISGGLGELRSIVSDKSASISDKIRDILGLVIFNVAKACVAVADAVRPTIQGIFNAIQMAFPETTAMLKSGFAVISSQIKSALMAAYTSVRESLQSIFSAVSEKLSPVINAVKDLVEKLSGRFRKQKEEINQTNEALGKFAKDLEHSRSQMAAFDEDAARLKATLDKTFDEVNSDEKDFETSTQNAGAAAEGLSAEVAEAGQKAAAAFKDASKSAADTEEATKETGDAADDSGAQFDDLGKKSEEAFNETEDGAKDAATGLDKLFKILGTVSGNLGKDLGGLPFKLKEIRQESPLVGSAISTAFGIAGEKVVSFLRDLKKTKEEAESNKGAMAAVGNAVETVTGKFSAFGAIAFGALERIGQKAVDAGQRLIKSLSVDQITAGWDEYGLKINSTQTIMASTGESLSTVNGYLEELNKYADKTIYSFSDMTANIGKFTNAGVDLDTAVAAIKGISNEAALSGANAQEASRAMYNFAQAISAGSVKLIDWKSIENANMATKGFKEELIKTAVELGTVKQSGEDYISVTKDANGHTADAFNATKNFNNSLSAQWMTTEVLTKTLAKYSNENSDLGKKAYAAAQDLKTGKQLLDAMQEAVGSGWSQTFELIIGDFNEAKKFWTGVNDLISPILDGISNARNGLLQGWRALGGREELLGSLKDGFTNLIDVIKAAKNGIETFIPPITAERIKDITGKLSEFIGKFKLSEEQLARVKDIFAKVGEGIKTVKDVLGEVGDKVASVFGKDFVPAGIEKLIGIAETLAEKFREFAKSKFAETIRNHIEQIGEVLNSVKSFATGLWEQIKTIASSVGGIFSSLGATAGDKFGKLLTLVQGVITFVKGAVDSVSAFIQKKLGGASKWLPGLLDIAMNVLGAIGNALKWVGEFMSKHADSVGKLIAKFVVLKAVIKFVTGPLVSIGLAVFDMTAKVKKAVGGLQTICEVIGKFGNIIGKVGGAIGKFITGVLAKFGLSLGAVIGPALGVVAAVAAVAAGIAIAYKVYNDKLTKNAEALYGLTDAEKEYNAAIIDSAEALKEQADARERTLQRIDGEYDYYEELANELKTLVDENGKVKEGYESRVNYITSELANGLGIEIDITGGVIGKYQELESEIDKLIQKKRIAAKLSALDEDVSNARNDRKEEELEYRQTKAKAEKDQLDYAKAKKEWDDAVAAYNEAARLHGDLYAAAKYGTAKNQADENLKAAEDALYNPENGSQVAADAAAEKYFSHLATADNYAKAEEAYMAGNMEAAEKYLNLLEEGFETAETSTKERLEAQRDHYVSLWQEAIKAGASQETIDEYRSLMDQAWAEVGKFDENVEKKKQEDAKKQGGQLIESYADGAEKAVPEAKARTGKAQNGVYQTSEEWGSADAEHNAQEAAQRVKSILASAMTDTGGGVSVSELLQKELLSADDPANISAIRNQVSTYFTLWRDAITNGEGPELANAYKQLFEGSSRELKTWNDRFSGAVSGALGKTGEGGVKSFTDTFGGVDSAITKKKDAVAFAAKNLGLESAKGVESTKDANEEASETVSSAIPEAADKTELRSEMKIVGYFGGMGLVLGLEKAKSSVIESAKSLAGVIPKTTAQTLQEKSPSKISEEQGGFWGEGLVVGMENLEKAVKRESTTLSETMIDGTSAPLSSLSDILNSEFDDSLTITPVLDLSQIQNGAGTLRGMIDGVSGIQIGAADVSGIVPNRFGERSSGDPTLAELQGLRQDMARFNERLGRLQVRMDKGALVGELVDPIDEELGYRAAIGQRG